MQPATRAFRLGPDKGRTLLAPFCDVKSDFLKPINRESWTRLKQYISNSTEETEQIAAQVAKSLHSGDVLAYRGGMGAGKTAFTRGLCQGLGLGDHVSSPTFALVHQYGNGPGALYHFDMYRVESFEDLYSTGFFDYLDYGGILAIEWSENIAAALPQGTITVTINHMENNPNRREIVIEGDERF